MQARTDGRRKRNDLPVCGRTNAGYLFAPGDVDAAALVVPDQDNTVRVLQGDLAGRLAVVDGGVLDTGYP